MLIVALMSEHADQCLSEDTLTRAAVVRINLTPFLYRAAFLTLDQSDTQVARSSHIALCPPFSPVLVHSSISLQSRIIFQRNSEPPGTSKCQNQVLLFFPFFSKDWWGQQALAQVGMHWHTLAHIGKRVVPTQWLPSHRGLPKQLQMTALSFSAPISRSTPLYFILLLPFSPFHSLSFPSSLCLFLPVFICCSESVNLMKD